MFYRIDSLIDSKEYGTYELSIGLTDNCSEVRKSIISFTDKGIALDGESLTGEDICNISIWEEEHPNRYNKVA